MTPRPRRASVPATEAFSNATVDARPPLNTVVIAIKIGDIIDVGILWGDWLTANLARLKTSTWAAAGAPAASPAAPTIVASSSVLDRATGETACVLDASAAAEGNVYYVENTVTIEADEDLTPLVFPTRTLVRRLHVEVFAG